ncbi:MAG: hypothetical protein QXU18_12830 [Thermoplasmatales archaeon]
MNSKKCKYYSEPINIFDSSKGYVNFYPKGMGTMKSYHEYGFVRKFFESDPGRKAAAEEVE